MEKLKKIMAVMTLAITIIVSVAYFVFTLLNSKNDISPLKPIINSFSLTIFSIFFVITSLFIKSKGKNIYVYYIIIINGFPWI
jgi:hypothetical protein